MVKRNVTSNNLANCTNFIKNKRRDAIYNDNIIGIKYTINKKKLLKNINITWKNIIINFLINLINNYLHK